MEQNQPLDMEEQDSDEDPGSANLLAKKNKFRRF